MNKYTTSSPQIQAVSQVAPSILLRSPKPTKSKPSKQIAPRIGTKYTPPSGAVSPFKSITGEFDGQDLILFGDGTPLLTLVGQSGRPVAVRTKDATDCHGTTSESYLNNSRYVGIQDYGAIPEGSYQFVPTELMTFSAWEQAQMTLGGHYTDPFGKSLHGGDWGAARVALRPVGKLVSSACGSTSKRSGFYLHGGNLTGSSGCIDIGNSGVSQLLTQISGYKESVTITVKYKHAAPPVGVGQRVMGGFTYPGQENPTIGERIEGAWDQLIGPAQSTNTPKVQPKLTVNTPGDKYEQEADRMADMVMRMPEPMVSREASRGFSVARATGKNLVQRQCATCAAKGHTSGDCPECKKKKQGLGGMLQRLSTRGDSAAGMAAPPIVSRVLSSPGSPLPADTRSFMESRFGTDFGHVRIHTDSMAAESAAAVQARAYTVGNHIAFGSGSSMSDHRLLAHELTHTIQQGTGSIQEPMIQRIPALIAANLIGRAWLELSPETKLTWIDDALDLVLTVVDKIPGQHLLGEMWSFIAAGMRGFFHSIRNAASEVKIAVVDKVASIMALKDMAFAGGMAKGLLKGFFVDGLLGPFVAVYDMVKSLPVLWDFLKHVGEMMDQFPDELGQLVDEAKQFGVEVSEKIGPALNEVKTYFFDPAKAAELVSQLAGHARGMAESLGGKIAGLMMNFFSAPGASAAIGEVGGTLIGNVIFEAVVAVLTGGGAIAVTGVKKGAAYMAKLAAKIGGKLLPVLKDMSILFEEAVSMIKGLVKLVKGKVLEPIAEKFAGILDRVKSFAKRIIGGCTENSPLKCNICKSGNCPCPVCHGDPKKNLGGLHGGIPNHRTGEVKCRNCGIKSGRHESSRKTNLSEQSPTSNSTQTMTGVSKGASDAESSTHRTTKQLWEMGIEPKWDWRDPKFRSVMGEAPTHLISPVAHHDLPVKYGQWFEWNGININDPKYGRWIEETNHHKWSYQFEKEWKIFIAKRSRPSKSEILDHMEKLRQKYK